MSVTLGEQHHPSGCRCSLQAISACNTMPHLFNTRRFKREKQTMVRLIRLCFQLRIHSGTKNIFSVYLIYKEPAGNAMVVESKYCYKRQRKYFLGPHHFSRKIHEMRQKMKFPNVYFLIFLNSKSHGILSGRKSHSMLCLFEEYQSNSKHILPSNNM